MKDASPHFPALLKSQILLASSVSRNNNSARWTLQLRKALWHRGENNGYIERDLRGSGGGSRMVHRHGTILEQEGERDAVPLASPHHSAAPPPSDDSLGGVRDRLGMN